MQERLYDLIFIARPATPEDEIKKVLSGIEHTCAEKGGKIEKTEHWGTRKLAYRVSKHREGIYVYQQIRTAHHELIAELGFDGYIGFYSTLKQIDLPHPYYYREMYLPQLTTGPTLLLLCNAHRRAPLAVRRCRRPAPSSRPG